MQLLHTRDDTALPTLTGQQSGLNDFAQLKALDQQWERS
jgi:hypothetical protein